MQNDHMKRLMPVIDDMKSDKVNNYVIAGLSSSLLDNGLVRVFENTRNHQDTITPHSHRFNFACLVLEGFVVNRRWIKQTNEKDGDKYLMSKLIYKGKIGKHTTQAIEEGYWSFVDNKYSAGQSYSMLAEEVHSISFSKGAKVLFFEGPQIQDCSFIIEPLVDGERIRTYESKSYMFKQGE